MWNMGQSQVLKFGTRPSPWFLYLEHVSVSGSGILELASVSGSVIFELASVSGS